MKPSRLIVVLTAAILCVTAPNDMQAQGFLKKLKDKTEKVKKGIEKVKKQVENITDSGNQNRRRTSDDETRKLPSDTIKEDTVHNYDSVTTEVVTGNSSGSSSGIPLETGVIGGSRSNTSSSDRKGVKSSLKVVADITASFPETAPDTLLVLPPGSSDAVEMVRRSKDSNYFEGKTPIDVSHSFFSLVQCGIDTLYERHLMIRHFDGQDQIWMPDKLLYAPDEPYASYPYRMESIKGTMVRSTSSIFINNPWTFVKIEWGFDIDQPTVMTVSANKGIAGWLEYKGNNKVVATDSSSTSVEIPLKTKDKYTWLAVPGGEVCDFTIAIGGEIFKFKNVELKKGKNINLRLRRKGPPWGFLKVNFCPYKTKYKVRITPRQNRIGWKLYKNEVPDPARIPKNTLAFQYAIVDEKLEFICFGLKPDVKYDLDVDIYVNHKKIQTLEYKDIKVASEKYDEIDVCPTLPSEIEVNADSCACPLPEKSMSLEELNELVRTKLSESNVSAKDNDRKLLESHKDNGHQQYIGYTDAGETFTAQSVIVVSEIIREMAWREKLHFNNPALINKYPNMKVEDIKIEYPRLGKGKNFDERKGRPGDSELIIDRCDSLKKLVIANTNLMKLEIKNCPNLVSVAVPFNNLTELKIECCPNLNVVMASSNYLEELTINCCPALKAIHVPFNELDELRVDNFENLVELDCSHNKLEELDVTNNERLITLVCPYNFISELDLTQNFNLENLCCTANDYIKVKLPEENNLKKYNIKGRLIDRSKLRRLTFDRTYSSEQ